MIAPADRDLLEAYLEDRLSVDARVALEQRLKQEPELADELLRASREESILQDWAKTEARRESVKNLPVATESAPVESVDAQPKRKPSTRRRIRVRRRAASKFPIWGVVSVAATILLFVVFHTLSQRSLEMERLKLGELTFVRSFAKNEPTPLLVRTNGQQRMAQSGTGIQSGDRLETRGAAVRFQFTGEATRLDIATDSIVTLRTEDGAKRIQLDRGTLDADVAKQPAGRPMVLSTPHASATVIGTRFKLTVTDSATRLDVAEGCVRFVRQTDGVSVDVAAGGSADSMTQTAGRPPVALRPALLVVNSLKLIPADEAVRERLERLGFSVTLKTAQEVTLAHADGAALVLVSTSVHSGIDAAVKSLRSTRAPLMTWEWHLFDDYGMTGLQETVDYGTDPARDHIAIVDRSHPLAAGLSGSVRVTTESMDLHWGKIGPAGIVIATVDGAPKHATIFGYESGAEMFGLRAPARRVGLFMTDDSPVKFTPQAWTLFDAAIRWCSSSKP